MLTNLNGILRKKVRFPKTILKAYPPAETNLVRPKNFMEFLNLNDF